MAKASKGSLTRSSLPNMISGVSQQPPSLRLPSNCEESVNAFPSVVSGLNKRPPTEHLLKLPSDLDENSIAYIIDRNTTYRYVVFIGVNTLRVFDLNTGTEQTVSLPQGAAYLTQSANPRVDYRFCTIGDTTFIANRKVTVTADDFGEQGNYAFSYTTVPTFTSLPGGPTVGQYVLVSDTNTFYKYDNTPATDDEFGWHYDGDATSHSGYTLTSELPAEVVVATKYAVAYNKITSYVNGTCIRYGVHGECAAYQQIPVFTTFYKKYTGQQTMIGHPASVGWVAQDKKDLPRTAVPNRLFPNTMGTIYVTQAIANTNYSVYVNGVLLANYLTPDGTSAATSCPGTDVIANNVLSAMTASGLWAGLGWTAVKVGSTISISGMNGTDLLQVQTSQGDKIMKCYQTDIDSFSNLPPNEVVGRIVRVKGDVKTSGDDYYVVYNSKNIWEETWGWNAGTRPAGTTMPHALVKEADGTWTFKEWVWDARAAGDSDSNPQPSFVGSQIMDLFLYSNRFAFLADENAIFSEANSFENFYRTTLATLVDSDRLDLAVLNKGVDILYHGISYNDDLLLMSDRNQYRLRYSNFLGPKNVEVKFSTSFNVSTDIHPISMGGSVYFVDDKSTYSHQRVWEYYPQVNQTGDDADNTSDSIPNYLLSGATFFDGSPRLKMVVSNSIQDPTALYTYKYYWGANNQKIQTSWQRWEFPDVQRVVWAGFAFNYLYCVMHRSDGYYFERITLEESIDTKNEVTRYMVDRTVGKSGLTLSYSGLDDTTTITLPYALGSTSVPEVVSCTDIAATDPWQDRRHTVTKLDSTHIKVDGDITGTTVVRAGIQYTHMHRFSKPYIRQQKGNGEVVILDQYRLQMRYLTLYSENAAYYTVTIAYPGRPNRVIEVDHFIADDESITIGGTSTRSKTDRIAIQGNNEDLTVEIANDTPFNAQFTSAEWSFVFNLRAKNSM